jgi:hypothetical protein
MRYQGLNIAAIPSVMLVRPLDQAELHHRSHSQFLASLSNSLSPGQCTVNGTLLYD